MGIETALIGAGVASAAGSVAGAAIGSGAASDAASAQVLANRESIAAQKEMTQKALDFYGKQYSQARQDLEPFREAQISALRDLQGFTDANSEFYQNERQQATEAIQRQLAAQGLLRSRKQVDLLSGLESDLTRSRLNVLGSLAGNNAAQQASTLAQTYGSVGAQSLATLGQNIGSSFQNMGQAQANAALQQGQLWSGAVQGVGNTLSGLAGDVSLLPAYKRIYGRLGGGQAPGAGAYIGPYSNSQYKKMGY